MWKGEVTILEAVLCGFGSLAILFLYGLVYRYLQRRDEQIRTDAYRRGREDGKADARKRRN